MEENWRIMSETRFPDKWLSGKVKTHSNFKTLGLPWIDWNYQNGETNYLQFFEFFSSFQTLIELFIPVV